MNPKFVMLVGLPASGKSTYRSNSIYDDFVHISTDDIVEYVADSLGESYNDVWETVVGDATTMAMEIFRKAVKERKSIIWDQTNLTEKKRRKALSQLPKAYEKVAVYFEVDEDVRSEYAATRPGKTISKSVIDGMRKNYVRPDVSEGFDKVICGVPSATFEETA